MRTTLWASTCWPSSQARVTSVKSLSSFRFPKAVLILSRKLFHCKLSFSSDLCIFTICCEFRQMLFRCYDNTFNVHILYDNENILSPPTCSQADCMGGGEGGQRWTNYSEFKYIRIIRTKYIQMPSYLVLFKNWIIWIQFKLSNWIYLYLHLVYTFGPNSIPVKTASMLHGASRIGKPPLLSKLYMSLWQAACQHYPPLGKT